MKPNCQRVILSFIVKSPYDQLVCDENVCTRVTCGKDAPGEDADPL